MMKKVCINDFSPSELQVWMEEFYPNGLNRSDLEKASNIGQVKSAQRKIAMFDKNELFNFSDSERQEYEAEILKLKHRISKLEELESDFVIARSWFRKSVYEHYDSKDESTVKLMIALNSINFEAQVLGFKKD